MTETKTALLLETCEKLQEELTTTLIENDKLTKELEQLKQDYECLMTCTSGGLA